MSKSLPWQTLTGLRTQAARASYPEFEAELLSRPEAKEILANSQ